MHLNLKKDDHGYTIQALAPDDSTTQVGTSSGASVRLSLPAEFGVVEVSCSAGIHWQFGDSAAVASSSNKYQGPSALVYKVPEGVTHIAFISAPGETSAVCSVTGLY